MTDPSSTSNRGASSVAPAPASPSLPSARMAPPRPRPQPTPVIPESPAPSRQRSTSVASTSSSRQPPPPQQQQQQQQVRRKPSREGGASISSSQQAPLASAQQPTSSSSVQPSSLNSGQPPFQPLYTVVANATSDTSYHPRVHYIFSDDDENEALAQALNHAAHRQQQYQHHHHHHHRTHSGGGGGNLRPPFPNPSRSASGSEDSLAHGNRDRAILLDLTLSADGCGWDVAQASSLSADWAVVSAQVTRLQQEGDDATLGNDDVGTQQSLMLRIEGVDGAGQGQHAHIGDVGTNLEGSRGSAGRASSSQAPEYGAIIDEFEKKMSVLRQVVEAGDGKGKGPEGSGSGRAELGVVEEESTEGER